MGSPFLVGRFDFYEVDLLQLARIGLTILTNADKNLSINCPLSAPR